MENKNIEDTNNSSTSEDHKDETSHEGDESNSTQQDPVKEALNKEGKKSPKYTPAQKAAYALKKSAEKLKDLGVDPMEIIGEGDKDAVSDDIDDDDDRPMTRGEFKRIEAERTTRTALQLADEQIENSDERSLAKTYLQNRIRPSGNPQEDLNSAMALVNSIKNKQVAEEINRKSTTTVRRVGSGSGAPPKREDIFEASPEELTAARIAKVKPEDRKQWILNAREGKSVVFGTARAKKLAEESKRNGY